MSLGTVVESPLSTRHATPWRGRAAFVLKLAVTAGVLGLLLGRADWQSIGGRLAAVSPGLLILAFAVKMTTVPFAAARWQAAAGALGARISYPTSLKVTLIGLFFGQVLPGGLGSDLVRGWLTWREGYAPSSVALALVLDRLAALFGVVVVLAAGLPHLIASAPPAVAWGAPIALAAVAAGLTAALLVDRLPLPRALRRLGPVVTLLNSAARLRAAVTGRQALAGLGFSVGVHMCTIAATLLYARALGIGLNVLDGLAAVPLTIVAAALPISLGGWGVREGSMVASLGLFGVPADEALLLSLMIGLSVLVMSVPGGLVWLAISAARRSAAGRHGHEDEAGSALS
jgi:uncharacterized membrane protein YbhN (UPF0104 family)